MTFAEPQHRVSRALSLALHWCDLSGRRPPLAPAGEVTALLRAWSAGDRTVESRLFEVILPDLQHLAQNFLRHEAPGHTLQTGALLNEAYLRLINVRERNWESRRHFVAIAARVMRRLLIDHARARPEAQFVGLDQAAGLLPNHSSQIEQALAVDLLLDGLERLHPELCQIVELRFFLGLTEEEAADSLGIPLRTAQRRFADARRWLFEKLEDGRA